MHIKLLVDLYEGAATRKYDNLNWAEWASANGYELADVDRAYEELKEQGLVKSHALGRYVEITTSGIVCVEQNELADTELMARQDEVKTIMLRDLLEVRNERGPSGITDLFDLGSSDGLEREEIYFNYKILLDYGMVERHGGSRIHLTARGVELARKVAATKALNTRWLELKSDNSNPQRRGHELEKLLGEVLEKEGYTVVLNKRSLGEENDLIASQGFSTFVFSCKWEKNPIGSPAVRDIRERVTARPGSIGVLVSVSGFTGEAVELAESRLESAVVLFLGEADLDDVFNSDRKLADLLLDKHQLLMNEKKIKYA
ncbi:MAG: restriction endonuclease [Armatimonadetes bacterium]|nr:restriction endonuclease [Armatimonadota bacterium]